MESDQSCQSFKLSSRKKSSPTLNLSWGGGALFFSIANRLTKAHLSDLNTELAITYKVVKDSPVELIRLLRKHSKSHAVSPKEYFESVRALSARQKEYQKLFDDPLEVAARLIYLNKCCFNGIYRVNKTGRFNAPWNHNSYFNFCEDSIMAASHVLKTSKAEITSRDFSKTKPKSGDFVYCDPPYDGTYDQYTEDKFSAEIQKELAKVVQKWASEGVNVMVSNSDTDLIRRLYKKFQVNSVAATRPVNADGTGRGPVDDLVITTY